MPTLSTPAFARVTEPIFRLSVEKYEEMIRVGVIGEDDPVELVEGVLVFKMPADAPHATVVGRCQDVLPARFSPGWFLRTEATILSPDSAPEPDAAVIRGKRSDYATRHPTSHDAALVIEVSDTTLAYDRTRKLQMYARAGVSVYWVINLIDRQIELYTDPRPDENPPTYASRRDLTAGEVIALPEVIGGATIRVADLLPS